MRGARPASRSSSSSTLPLFGNRGGMQKSREIVTVQVGARGTPRPHPRTPSPRAERGLGGEDRDARLPLTPSFPLSACGEGEDQRPNRTPPERLPAIFVGCAYLHAKSRGRKASRPSRGSRFATITPKLSVRYHGGRSRRHRIPTKWELGIEGNNPLPTPRRWAPAPSCFGSARSAPSRRSVAQGVPRETLLRGLG